MGRADTGDAPRHDLPTLGNEGREHPHVFIVNVVDLFYTESTDLLAPEVLFLGGQRFIAAGGPHGPANGTSASLFGHVILLPSQPQQLSLPAMPREQGQQLPEPLALVRLVLDQWVRPPPSRAPAVCWGRTEA